MKDIATVTDELANDLKALFQEYLRQGREWQLDLADLRPVIKNRLLELGGDTDADLAHKS